MESIRSDRHSGRSRQLAALFVIFLALSASAALVMEHQDVSDADTAVIAASNDGYIITFKANGGTPENQQRTTDAQGHVTDLPTVSRDGYKFDGWFTKQDGGSKVTENTVFDHQETVYAHWSEKPSDSANNLLYIFAGLMAAVMIVGLTVVFLVMKRAKSKGDNN